MVHVNFHNVKVILMHYKNYVRVNEVCDEDLCEIFDKVFAIRKKNLKKEAKTNFFIYTSISERIEFN